MAQRVVIAEEIAQSGLDLLTNKGFEVDVALDADRRQLLERIAGASALVVRSGTQVDSEVLDAADKLEVVGRAGIGLDNIDVEYATKRGVMVVNAPQSNILSAAEHTVALLLGLARNIAPADAAMKKGEWARSRFTGVEVADKILGIVGLGKIGSLVAQRASALGMRLTAFDPYVSEDRARQMGVEMLEIDELCKVADFIVLHMPRTPETAGIISAERIALMKPTARIINTARGELIDEAALANALAEGRLAGAAIDVYAKEPPSPDSPILSAPNTLLTPHLGASTSEAQDKAGVTIAEQVALALTGDLVPFAVNIEAGSEVDEQLRPFLPLAETLGALFTALAGGVASELDITFLGQLADYDNRVLALAVQKGLFSAVMDEPVSFVNAPVIAESKGVNVRKSTSASSSDYVNLIRVGGVYEDRAISVAGTVAGYQGSPRIVEIDEHAIDLPPSRFMLVVHNDDRPGVIGRLGTILGDAGVNIANMAVGRDSGGKHALMGLNVDTEPGEEVLATLNSAEGILSVDSITLEGAPEEI